jgi:hypothetical protein
MAQLYKRWTKDFNFIMELIKLRHPSITDVDLILWKSAEWVNLFISLPMEGHQKKNVTPYIHMMAKHCPDQMRRLGGIMRFSGQGNLPVLLM